MLKRKKIYWSLKNFYNNLKQSKMKANLITATIVNASLLMALVTPALSQIKRKPGSQGRSEYVQVEPNVKLHVTDLGEGEPWY
jgi:hypothetical protein